MGIGRIVQDIGHASGSWHLSLVPCAFRFAIVVALRWRGLRGNWGEEPTAAAGTTISATATTNTLLRMLLTSITKKRSRILSCCSTSTRSRTAVFGCSSERQLFRGGLFSPGHRKDTPCPRLKAHASVFIQLGWHSGLKKTVEEVGRIGDFQQASGLKFFVH